MSLPLFITFYYSAHQEVSLSISTTSSISQAILYQAHSRDGFRSNQLWEKAADWLNWPLFGVQETQPYRFLMRCPGALSEIGSGPRNWPALSVYWVAYEPDQNPYLAHSKKTAKGCCWDGRNETLLLFPSQVLVLAWASGDVWCWDWRPSQI